MKLAKKRKPDPWELWDPVLDWELFRLRTQYAPQGMPPVCIIRFGMKEGLCTTLEQIQPSQ